MRLFIKKVLFLLALFTVSFSNPAMAVIESVAPVSLSFYFYGALVPAGSAVAQCSSMVAIMGYPANPPLVSGLLCTGVWNDGSQHFLGSMPAPSCPAPLPVGSPPYVFNSATSMCERNNPCPVIANDGYHIVAGSLVGTVPPPGQSFCDSSTSCEVSITSVVSVFGVGVVRSQSLPVMCGSLDSAPPPITAKITPAQSQAVQDVAAAAAAVDPAVTLSATTEAAIAKAAAIGAQSALDAAVTAAQFAASAQSAAKTALQKAGNAVTVQPNTTNMNIYNSAMTNYNLSSITANNALTTLNSSYQAALTSSANAGDVSAASAAQNQAVKSLQTALAVSTAAFDAVQVATKTAGSGALDSGLAAVAAAVQALSSRVTSASSTSTSVTNTVINNNSVVNNTSTTINNVAANNPGLPPVTPPIQTSPVPPGAASSVLPVPVSTAPAAGAATDMGPTNSLLQRILDIIGLGSTPYSGTADAQRITDAHATDDTAIHKAVDDSIAQQVADELSTDGIFTLPFSPVACTPFSKVISGKAVVLDLCQYTEMLRSLIGWLFALFGAYEIYGSIFRKPG